MEDDTNYEWSSSLNKKFNLNTVMIALLKDHQATHLTTEKTACSNDAGENKSFESFCKQEEM